MALGHVSRDVRRVCLALDTGTLEFRPGQHILLSVGGLTPRPYAIASLPNDPLLELHVQHWPTGMGAYAASRLRVGDRAIVWGPTGTPFPLDGDGPVVAVADGAGLSAVGGAVLAALGADAERRVMLYVGARTASDLYDERLLRWLTERCPHFALSVCVREGGVPAASYRRISIPAALAADRHDLRDAVVIAAGAAPILTAVVSAATALGARPGRIATVPFLPNQRPAGRLARWFGEAGRVRAAPGLTRAWSSS